MTDRNSDVGLLEGFISDISDRKLAESSLLRSESLYRALINNIPDLVWLKDKNCVYLGCNRTAERFFGAPESEIVGKTDYDFIDTALSDFFRENDRKAITAGAPSINNQELIFA